MPGLSRARLCLALAWVFLAAPAAGAPAAPSAEAQRLLAAHRALEARLKDSVFGAPLHILSEEQDGLARGEVYGVLDYAFARIADALRSPREWCEIVPLHLNIKACTHHSRDGKEWLTLYSGRKLYAPPEKVNKLVYEFRRDAALADYVGVSLAAESGPLGSEAHLIAVEAMPLGKGRSLLHFRYQYRQQAWTRVAVTGYLATLGSGKVGFSATGSDAQGRPIYVRGVKGIVERNAMRYYLAIQAYLEAPGAAPMQFERRIARWFDLTERYRTQLHELERAEYLQYKRQERRQQLARQQALDAVTQPPN